MATVTLSANTNYSALTVANGDTIELAGFTLNFDVVPAETGVIVQTPGTTGKLTFALTATYPLTGWVMTAGTGPLIATVASGQTIGGSIVAGSAAGAHGIFTNNGTVDSATGGSANNAIGISVNNGTVNSATGSSTNAASGVNTNNGTVNSATGGSATNAHGIFTNNGTVDSATGGSTNNASGVSTNNGTVDSATGGIANGAHGVSINNGTVNSATGGSASGAYGISTNNGMITGAMTDSTGRAVNTWNGSTCFVNGPNCNAVIPNNIQTIYSLGALSGGATISGTATVIDLALAGGGTAMGGGFGGGFRRGI